MEVSISLESLRADVSYALRQKHYTDTVRILVNALEETALDLEEGEGFGNMDDSMSDWRYQF